MFRLQNQDSILIASGRFAKHHRIYPTQDSNGWLPSTSFALILEIKCLLQEGIMGLSAANTHNDITFLLFLWCIIANPFPIYGMSTEIVWESWHPRSFLNLLRSVQHGKWPHTKPSIIWRCYLRKHATLNLPWQTAARHFRYSKNATSKWDFEQAQENIDSRCWQFLSLRSILSLLPN